MNRDRRYRRRGAGFSALSLALAPVSVLAPGCYRVEPLWHCFVRVAANELPLRDEPVAFLVARSGRALDEFGRWVAGRRPIEFPVVARHDPTASCSDDEARPSALKR
ncbi:hypothetical protein WME89_22295 [Sorangium sp. So ce321]|uniref:hypothetical protein n=1 Tax=Sorangium sp. So ce321 TaxID=3133300 RepID=UPI003F60D330